MYRRHTTIWTGTLALVLALGLGLAPQVTADEWTTIDDSRWCRSGNWDDGERYCEVREITLPADRDVVAVDGATNGGIEVEGWDRDEIRLQCKVAAWADDEDDVMELIDNIEIKISGETIRAEGPKQGRHRNWSVSYRLMVPAKSNLRLETLNGGIAVSDVEGEIYVDATNGGLHLSRLAGDVEGQTSNGGLQVELSGDRWKGAGMNVRSTNGGISLEIPDDYSADLETGTVNGQIEIDFPITVQGKIGRSLKATLGDGGAPVIIKTTNGGVLITRA